MQQQEQPQEHQPGTSSIRQTQNPQSLTGKKSKFARTVPSNSNEFCTNHKPDEANKSKQLVRDERVSEQTYWGKVKPYWFDAITNTPRIIIAPTIIRCLLLNILIIAVICVTLPLLATNNNQQQTLILPTYPKERMHSQNTKDNLIYIFSGAWTCYQLVFLAILLLGNPGYGDPLAEKQLSLQQQEEIGRGGRRKEGYSRCNSCKAIVDNSVFHCPECDLCCQGFRHHCEWIGKCIGYRSEIFLNAYYYGFFIGIFVLMLLMLAHTNPQ